VFYQFYRSKHLTSFLSEDQQHACLSRFLLQFRLQKVDVTVYTYRNGVIRVEDQEATLYASIDIVCDKVGKACFICKSWHASLLASAKKSKGHRCSHLRRSKQVFETNVIAAQYSKTK